MDINKIISIVKTFKEEAVPTMNVGTGEKSLGYNIETGTPPVKKNRNFNYAKGGRGSRRWWLQFLKGK